MTTPLILILCTGNSCRSQMAEAFLKSEVGETFRVASAGSNPSGYIHPLAFRAMEEAGPSLEGHRSKHLDEFLDQNVETVITVCGNAAEACPIFPGGKHKHHFPFDDPADAEGTDQEKMEVFRRVREEIKTKFATYAKERLNGFSDATAT